MVEVMNIIVTSKRFHALLHSVPPMLYQATANPHLHQRLLDTHGQVWVSLLWGHCSFLLGPGALWVQGSVCALQESISPVLCKFWQLYGGVNGDLLQEGLCHPQVCCTQPYPNLLHLEPLPLWQSTAHPYLHRRHSDTVLSQSVWGLWVLVHTRFVSAL